MTNANVFCRVTQDNENNRAADEGCASFLAQRLATSAVRDSQGGHGAGVDITSDASGVGTASPPAPSVEPDPEFWNDDPEGLPEYRSHTETGFGAIEGMIHVMMVLIPLVFLVLTVWTGLAKWGLVLEDNVAAAGLAFAKWLDGHGVTPNEMTWFGAFVSVAIGLAVAWIRRWRRWRRHRADNRGGLYLFWCLLSLWAACAVLWGSA